MRVQRLRRPEIQHLKHNKRHRLRHLALGGQSGADQWRWLCLGAPEQGRSSGGAIKRCIVDQPETVFIGPQMQVELYLW